MAQTLHPFTVSGDFSNDHRSEKLSSGTKTPKQTKYQFKNLMLRYQVKHPRDNLKIYYFYILNCLPVLKTQTNTSYLFSLWEYRLEKVPMISWLAWVCLFLGEFIVPLENFSLIWRRHHYRWRAANFFLCSALMAIEQWGFYCMPHLLWHGASVYNVISEDPWHLHLLPNVYQWSFHFLFNDGPSRIFSFTWDWKNEVSSHSRVAR